MVCRIVVAHALMHAIPSLDLVLTPNGFGIVSNQNIAPASRERVERLIASVEQQRDDAIILLQKQLFRRADWQKSEVFGYWSQTLLPNISVCHQLRVSEELNEKTIGRIYEVIVDEIVDDGVYSGRTRYDSPEIDCNVTFESSNELYPGDIVNVRINNAYEYDLEGEEV